MYAGVPVYLMLFSQGKNAADDHYDLLLRRTSSAISAMSHSPTPPPASDSYYARYEFLMGKSFKLLRLLLAPPLLPSMTLRFKSLKLLLLPLAPPLLPSLPLRFKSLKLLLLLLAPPLLTSLPSLPESISTRFLIIRCSNVQFQCLGMHFYIRPGIPNCLSHPMHLPATSLT